MDWNIFWSAFSAIGTTAGTLLTSLVIYITYKQYTQPLRKILKITCYKVIKDIGVGNIPYLCLRVYNYGVRCVTIDEVFIEVDRKKFSMDEFTIRSSSGVELPLRLEPEDYMLYYMSVAKIIRKFKLNQNMNTSKSISITVIDGTGKEYTTDINDKI